MDWLCLHFLQSLQVIDLRCSNYITITKSLFALVAMATCSQSLDPWDHMLAHEGMRAVGTWGHMRPHEGTWGPPWGHLRAHEGRIQLAGYFFGKSHTHLQWIVADQCGLSNSPQVHLKQEMGALQLREQSRLNSWGVQLQGYFRGLVKQDNNGGWILQGFVLFYWAGGWASLCK